MKTVLAFGTFDILHPGHLYYLRRAKKFGDKLIVIIARDSTVKKIKKRFPKNDEKTRLRNIKQLEIVNNAFLGYKIDRYRIIEKLKPDVICIGYDQSAPNIETELKKRKLKVKIIKLRTNFKAHTFKSSKLRNRNN